MGISEIMIIIGVGVLAGVLSGAVGIGGGVLLVPAMVYILGYSQKTAQGTTLAMLMMPVVALGVWHYYKAGHVEWKTALILGAGFVLGGWFGARFSVSLPEKAELWGFIITHPLKKLFATVIIILGIKMLFE